jgi:hypothetical protein
MAHTANSFILNIVELVHWIPIIPAFLMSSSILENNQYCINSAIIIRT